MTNTTIKIGVCIGIILIATVASFLSSDEYKEETLPTVDTSDYENSSFFYYGEDTPAGSSGYTYAVVINGSPIYMDDYEARKLADAGDYSMKTIMAYDLDKYSGRYSPKAYILGTGGVNAVFDTSHETDYSKFEFKKIKDFKFSYKTNQTVGYNKNAKIVSEVYYLNGTLME